MANIKFFRDDSVPVEMHKVRIIQKIHLIDVDARLKAVKDAGNNTFLLHNKDVFLDMLTDSGVNAMSDNQLSAMLVADDAYAGSETYYKLEETVNDFFGTKYFLPAHQGRACEHLISEVFVKPNNVVPMNYHFTTAKAHITAKGGKIIEVPIDEAFVLESSCPFKGNIDLVKLEKVLAKEGNNVPFVRMEAGTNLIGGQPFSLANLKEVYKLTKKYKRILVLDASLLTDNVYFIKTREAEYKDKSVKEIIREMSANADVIYFSARKLSSARGGGICTSNVEIYEKIRELIPVYEGFLTYGGISVKEMEAMNVGFKESLDFDMISHGPQFIKYMADELIKRGLPIVTPSGGLGCHLNATKFVSHIKQTQYPAGALVIAIYLISGIRGMERGTLSEQRDEDGKEHLSEVELVRLALPRRVFTLSQVKFAIDRLDWLYQNRQLIQGLKWTEEPKNLRFFFGRLAPTSDWQEKLVAKFKKDFGDSL
jgi:tryptophanase